MQVLFEKVVHHGTCVSIAAAHSRRNSTMWKAFTANFRFYGELSHFWASSGLSLSKIDKLDEECSPHIYIRQQDRCDEASATRDSNPGVPLFLTHSDTHPYARSRMRFFAAR